MDIILYIYQIKKRDLAPIPRYPTSWEWIRPRTNYQNYVVEMIHGFNNFSDPHNHLCLPRNIRRNGRLTHSWWLNGENMFTQSPIWTSIYRFDQILDHRLACSDHLVSFFFSFFFNPQVTSRTFREFLSRWCFQLSRSEVIMSDTCDHYKFKLTWPKKMQSNNSWIKKDTLERTAASNLWVPSW